MPLSAIGIQTSIWQKNLLLCAIFCPQYQNRKDQKDVFVHKTKQKDLEILDLFGFKFEAKQS